MEEWNFRKIKGIFVFFNNFFKGDEFRYMNGIIKKRNFFKEKNF